MGRDLPRAETQPLQTVHLTKDGAVGVRKHALRIPPQDARAAPCNQISYQLAPGFVEALHPIPQTVVANLEQFV